MKCSVCQQEIEIDDPAAGIVSDGHCDRCGNMAVAGENIEAGCGVVLCDDPPNKAGEVFSMTNSDIGGVVVGTAIENIREGFRVSVRHGKVREDDVKMIAESGRPEVLGLKSARSCWHSISPAQAHTLAIVGAGRRRELRRNHKMPSLYDVVGDPQAVKEPYAIRRFCRLSTARALCAHGLLAPDGGAPDPEAKFVITERGVFVLRFGHHVEDWYRP